MSKAFRLEIVTPEIAYYDGMVESVIVETTDGFEGYMADHTPCCKQISRPGQISFRQEGEQEFRKLTLNGGFVKVKESVLIFTDSTDEE